MSNQYTKIKKILLLLHKHYIFNDKITILHNKLINNFKNGKYNNISGGILAGKLYDDIYSILKDKHIIFEPNEKEVKIKYDKDFFHKWIQSKIIKSNIGYIKIDTFLDFGLDGVYNPKVLEDIPKTKMKLICNSIIKYIENVKDCNYIIFDMRNNGGGEGQIAKLLLSFIFNRRIILEEIHYKTETRKYYTLTNKELQELCNCKKLPTLYNNEIICLTSKNTFSAGEQFCYDIQSRKRGIIIGEITGGGANPGEFYTIDKEMKIFIPFAYTKNPITKTNWEGKGVKPNIVCKSKDALKCAIEYIN